MCLLTRQICPIKAKKAIEVYKLLLVDSVINNSFLTPWTRTKTRLNTHFIAEGDKTNVQSDNVHIVGSGYIHCYTNIKNAKYAKKYLVPRDKVYKTVITKCIIEPGTRYYKSWDGEEIAADSVFVKEIIET